ncbi:MAG: hypothetical protein GY953_34415, partial [bacterium]|nr:hypothetical protein [bacterium]
MWRAPPLIDEPVPLAVFCEPPVTDECALGETDRLDADTDDDGIPDSEEGTFICGPASGANPNGRRPVQFWNPNPNRFTIGVQNEALVR